MTLSNTTLEGLCSLVTDGTHDSPKLQESGIPFIKGKHISSGRIDFDNCDFITPKDHEKVIARSKPEYGDILFSNIGSVGDTALVRTRREFSIKNVALFKPDYNKVNYRYLYYLVSSPVFRDNLLNKRSGAAQPFIGLQTLREHSVQFHPNLDEQRKIAAILSAYDDLIENNRRRIAILEEMARNLYREWFVKFRFPLFRDDGAIERIHDPERDPMQDSPLGPIPQGWEVKTLVDVADLTMGQSPKSDFYNTDGEVLPFHQGVTDFGTRYPRNRVYSTEGTRKAYQGDILFSVRAPVGRINISTCTMILGRGLAAIRSIDGKQTFLYHQLNHMFQEEDIIGNGAILKAVTKKDMQAIKMTKPPSVLADAFECYATPHFQYNW